MQIDDARHGRETRQAQSLRGGISFHNPGKDSVLNVQCATVKDSIWQDNP